MTVDKYFIRFVNNITLTPEQAKDARTKYRGICKTLHNEFYISDYNGINKYLFGSYKKKTNIRPIISSQDVDVLFILPDEEFDKYMDQSAGQSNLLTKIKDTLKNTYTTTDKIKNWGKVVLVQFTDGNHNVELLPAKTNEDGTFTIPNTENAGSWDMFDPKKDVDKFFESNKKSNNYTRVFIKILKNWYRNCSDSSIKSYEIDDLVINYFYQNEFISYPETLLGIFELLKLSKDETFVTTAIDRSKKALAFLKEFKLSEGIEEYRKIFSTDFPVYNSQSLRFSQNIDVASSEEFIEDLYLVEIDENISFNLIDKYNKSVSGFRPINQSTYVKNKSLLFEAIEIEGIEKQNINFKWKIRNYGHEASSNNCLRGSIEDGGDTKIESTSYAGKHEVTCYILKKNIVVAQKTVNVNII